MPSTPQEFIGQALSIVALIITIVSYQFNDKRKLLVAQIISTACLAGSYLLLGATAGFYLNIVGIARNVCYTLQPKCGIFRFISGACFSLAMAVVGIWFWSGPSDLLIIIALVINSFMLSAFSAQALRYSILFTCALMTTYAAISMNIGAVCNESFSIVSSAVGILRYRKGKNG